MHEWTVFATSLIALLCINAVYSRSMRGSDVGKKAADVPYNSDSGGVNSSFDSNNFEVGENNSTISRSTLQRDPYKNKWNLEYPKKKISARRHRLSKRNARLLRERYNSKNRYGEPHNPVVSSKPTVLSTVFGKHKIQVSSRWKDFDVHMYNNGYKIIIKPLLRHEIEITPEENQIDSSLKENHVYDGTLKQLPTSNDLVYQNKYPTTETANSRTISYEDYEKYFSRTEDRFTSEKNLFEEFTHGYGNVKEPLYHTVPYSGSKPLNSVYTESYELSSDEFTHEDQNKVKEFENSKTYSEPVSLSPVYTESYELSSDEFTSDYQNKVQYFENSVKYLATTPLHSVNTENYKLSSNEFTHDDQIKLHEFENSIKYSEPKPLSSVNTESYKLSSDELTHGYQNKVQDFENSMKYSGTKPLHSVNTDSNKSSSNKVFTTGYENQVQEFENTMEHSEYKPLQVSTQSYKLSSNKEYSSRIVPQEICTAETTKKVEIHGDSIDEDSESLNEEHKEVSTTDNSLKRKFTSEDIGSFENMETSKHMEFEGTMPHLNTKEYNEITNEAQTTSRSDAEFQNFTFHSLGEIGKEEKDEFDGFEGSGIFPAENSLTVGDSNQDELSSIIPGRLEDSLGDTAAQLDGGSGSEGISEIEGFESNINRSGKIFNLFSTQTELSKCTTPKGEPGRCRRFRDCLMVDTLNNFNNFLQYLCLIRGALVGVCCPDNPVVEVTDAEPQNSTEPLPQEIKLPPEGCGLNTKTRIVGGKVSIPHEWTWMVALMRKNKFFCGGVIINNWYVLTAAHCVLGTNVRDLKVRLGEYNFNSKTDHQRDIPVAEIKRHAQFVTLTFQHDIALLKLRRVIEYTKFVGSICLPGQEGRDYSDVNGTVVGWGTVSFGGAASSVLREVTIPVWKNEECDRIYLLEKIGDTFLCAGSPDNGEDACQGDSGGPLMALSESGRWEVIGIVSWGRRCGDPTYPGVYTRVTSYLDWIRENAQ